MASKQQTTAGSAGRPSTLSNLRLPSPAVNCISAENISPPRACRSVKLGNQNAHLVIAGDSYIIARVPEAALVGELVVATGNLAERSLRNACRYANCRQPASGREPRGRPRGQHLQHFQRFTRARSPRYRSTKSIPISTRSRLSLTDESYRSGLRPRGAAVCLEPL